jgi:hypothetical protein
MIMTRRLPIFLALAIAVSLGGVAAWQHAAGLLRTRIEQALGPRGAAREINIGLGGIEILDLRIRAPENASWPGEDEARARRVLIVPDIFDLLTARLSINEVRVEGPCVVLLRTKAGGMKAVPSLFDGSPSAAEERGDKKEDGKKTVVTIDTVTVSDGVIEFYDESIRATPLGLRVEQVTATVGRLRLSDLAGSASLKIDGTVKGGRQDGKLDIDGSFDVAAKEYSLSTRLRGMDMTVLQPYLLRASETGIRRGTLDVELKSLIAGGRLRAPGTLTLSDLELAPGSKTFMGLTHSVAASLLKDKKGRISLKFTLEGDVDDPRFSLNEELVTRLGLSLAGLPGINLKSLVKDVGQAGGDSARAIGKSIDRLFGKRRGRKP